jgi:hypothetical protein
MMMTQLRRGSTVVVMCLGVLACEKDRRAERSGSAPNLDAPVAIGPRHELAGMSHALAEWRADTLVVAGTLVRPESEGRTRDDVLVVTFDDKGTELWRREIAGPGNESIEDLAVAGAHLRVVVRSNETFQLDAHAFTVPALGAGEPEVLRPSRRFEIMLDARGSLVRGGAIKQSELHDAIGLPDGTFFETHASTSENSSQLRWFDAGGATLWENRIPNVATGLEVAPWKPLTVIYEGDSSSPSSQLAYLDLASKTERRARSIGTGISTRFAATTPDGITYFTSHEPDPEDARTGALAINTYSSALVEEPTREVTVKASHRFYFGGAAFMPDHHFWVTGGRDDGVAFLLHVSKQGELLAEVPVPGFSDAAPVVAGPRAALVGRCSDDRDDARKKCIQIVKAH